MKNVALITGASSGIGKQLAQLHAQSGGDLVLIARRKQALATLKEELESKFSINAICIAKDLTEPNAVKDIYDHLCQNGIQLDYLINNAGFGSLGRFDAASHKQVLDMIDLNISALTRLCRYFIPDFIQRNQGKILNVSSIASIMPGPLNAVYYASKAYVSSFSNAIAEELKHTGVTVTNLLPGATNTEFASISGMDKTAVFDKSASAMSVAEAGYQGMLLGKLNVFAGIGLSQRIKLWLLPMLPKKIVLKEIYKMQSAES